MAFKVIEGGGQRPPGDFDVQMAVQSLRHLMIELLRAVARGDDPQHRVADRMLELYRNLGKTGIMVDAVVNAFLSDAYADIAGAGEESERESDDADREIEDIVLASFQLAAEKLCLDDAAQGRASQRERRLEGRIEARLRGIKERSKPSQREAASSMPAGMTNELALSAAELLAQRIGNRPKLRRKKERRPSPEK
jgi:hypothetical protein